MKNRIKACRDGALVDIVAGELKAASDASVWPDFVLQEHFMPPSTVEPHITPWHLLAVPLTPGAREISWRANGAKANAYVSPETVTLQAAGDEVSVWWKDPFDVIMLSINPLITTRISPDDLQMKPLEVTSQIALRDPVLPALIRVLHSDVKAGQPSGRLFGETIMHALALHLAGMGGSRPPHSNHALSPARYGKICEYIEANLDKSLSVSDIASAAGLSPYHLNRAFRKTTGRSLWAWVLERRVHNSRALIQGTRRSLQEISQEVGFETYGQFVAAFRKHYGMPPRQFRQQQ